MLKTLNSINQVIKFDFLSDANCWRADVLIDNKEIEFEIDFEFHKEITIDWEHFESFLEFINKPNRLKDYISQTNNVTLNLARTIFKNSDETKEWAIFFASAIYYNGKSNNNNFSYSLIYRYRHPTGGFGDDYGIYLAEYVSNNLTAVRRYQC